MAQSNNSIKKILTVAFALCIVCSIIVSTAAVALRSKQQLNQELDRKTNILNVADLYEPGDDVAEEFQKVTPKVVDLRSGEYTDEFDPDNYSGFEAARDPAQSRTLSGETDIAGLSRQENYSTVYLVGDPDDPEQVILPIRGQGLWADAWLPGSRGRWQYHRRHHLLLAFRDAGSGRQGRHAEVEGAVERQADLWRG